MDVILTEMGGHLIKILCEKATHIDDGASSGVTGENVWYVGMDEDHYFITPEEELDPETEAEIKKLLGEKMGATPSAMHRKVRITGTACIVFTNQ
ncbi:MAG: hypothetical protein P9L92_03525 [Candidatus Electryonea clarkiae]|nr:hypothetical protein [Candidatus Electryonea clarkiae]MDP8287449.1 hypothetical protein [Candidatus Electryonea clarkiae]